MQMLWTIKVQSFFRQALGITSDDIRSFQLCKTNSGYYHTVYLKDLPETDARSSAQTAWAPHANNLPGFVSVIKSGAESETDRPSPWRISDRSTIAAPISNSSRLALNGSGILSRNSASALVSAGSASTCSITSIKSL